jgi:hypothetical protein
MSRLTRTGTKNIIASQPSSHPAHGNRDEALACIRERVELLANLYERAGVTTTSMGLKTG